MRDGAGRRPLSGVLAAILVAGGLVVVAGGPEARSDRPDWVDALAGQDQAATSTVESGEWQASSTAVLGKSTPAPASDVAFPAPGRWDVALTRAKDTDSGPVRVRAADAAAEGDPVRVEVLNRTAAEQIGASGFAFTVAPPAGTANVNLAIDYSGIATAYGAGYADRLRLLAFPSCVLLQSVPKTCDRVGRPVTARVDTATRTVVADRAVAEAGTVFALASGVSGDEGTFAATPLSVTGTWQVSPGSGEFSYSYPIAVPSPAGGSPPALALGYSSGAIDGLTVASNNQASPTGLGWSDFANGFIERRYEPCFAEIGTTDLCWKSDNAVISLGGVSSALVPVYAADDPRHVRPPVEWKVQSDPGWKVERLTGAAYTNIHEGQYWKVTGPDGTVYYFGYGHMPGQVTNSILAVPVIADHAGEPCRGANNTVGGCDQGWRWYLDRVVDPDGNVQSYVYEREENWYSAVGGLAGNDSYHRAALLKEIWYGGRDWDSANYAARVVFGLDWRCNTLKDTCPAPNAGNGEEFHDVPNDLICTRTSACTVHSPAFFTGRRYAHVRTEVKVGTAWKPVAQHNFYHGFGDGLNGVARKLQLESIQHAGVAFGKLNAYPSTMLTYTRMDNRIDHDGQIPKAMRHRRLTGITNPFGGSVTVAYGFNRQCTASYDRHDHWDDNDRDCFPQRIKDGNHLRTGLFNKYLVKQVTEKPGGGSPDMTTVYGYEGAPAWAYDYTAFARDDEEIGWAVWRGYGTATIAKGASKSRLRLFRGLHNDLAMKSVNGEWVPIGRRVVEVPALTGPGSYVDHPGLGGRTLEEQQLGVLNGVGDSVLESRRHEYVQRLTYDPGEDYEYKPEWVGLASTTELIATAPGIYRERLSRTTYNAHFQPTTTKEEGWLDVVGDERCTITTYADNSDKGMYVYPSGNRKVAGDCSSTQVLTQSETYYDNSTVLGAPPSRGNPTRVRTLIEGNRWSESTTEYDALGRPIKVVAPTGGVTVTVYGVTAGAPVTQIPVRTTVTNALNHVTVTNYAPEFGVPTREQDANGNVSEYGYDEFGRLETVWLPTEPVAFAEPSWRFSYDIPNRAVRSRQLVSDSRCCETAVFEDSWTIYDGMWRERQVQSPSPASGKVLVSEVTYDERGQVRDETVEQAVTGTAGRLLTGAVWLNRTRHQYDELGREFRKEWFRTSTVAHATTSVYSADTVTVTGPDGRRIRERMDGLGRVVAVEEFDGSAWVSSAYTYDLGDRLLSVTDPAGNRITYTYNQVGWRTGQQDPNRGSATFGYDDAGNQTSIEDARGASVHTRYDALGRKTERRSGSATGPLLASWTYDTALNGKGQQHRETTYTADGNWVTEVVSYDAKARPLENRLTVPAAVAGLAGQYSVKRTYDRADRVRTMTYPAIGGLSEETVTTTYNNLGLPTRMASPLAEYVSLATYDDRGRRAAASFGPRPGGSPWLARSWTYNVDQQLNGAETYLAGSTAPNGVVADHELSFDAGGNLAEQLTRQNGASWRECYGYDARSRLTSAHTVAASTSCVDGAAGTGDRPYAHGYQYSPDGKLTNRVENGVTTAYTYPASGGTRPHAPTRIGADTYTWDAAGNLATRTVGGQSETYAWDPEGRLGSVTGPSGRTAFVYDANGNRLLRRTPDGHATLYVAGHEITASSSGTVARAVRSYAFEGLLVATRTPAGVEYLTTDVAGSVELAVPAGGQPNATRTYVPYGKTRAETGAFATERGFLGQVADPTTRLSYLNARYYDPAVGVFISGDPVYDTAKVKSLNPYSYSVNNPATFADPSGLYSMYTYGLEVENAHLKRQNRQLIAHIGKLNNHIEELQGIIVKQQKQIGKMVTYIGALEAEISRQASIIRQLQRRVAYLEGVVAAQRREISRLRTVVARQQQIIRYQAGVIRYQAGVIRYQRGVIVQLVHHAFLPQFHASVLTSIFSGNGIPSWQGSRVTFLQAAVQGLSDQNAAQAVHIGDLESANESLSGLTSSLFTLSITLSNQLAAQQTGSGDGGGGGGGVGGGAGGGGGGSWGDEGDGGPGVGDIAVSAGEGCAAGLIFGSPAVIGGPPGWAAAGGACVAGGIGNAMWDVMFG